MKTLRQILFALTFVVLSTGVNAQIKVVERSEKKQPEWLANPDKESIVVKGDGVNLEEAQNAALDILKNRLATIIADKQFLGTEYFNKQSIDRDSAIKIIRSSAYCTGFSIDNIDRFYWEKTKDKATKNEGYIYHVSLVTANLDMGRIIDEVVEDHKITVSLHFARNVLQNYKTVEDLIAVWRELMIVNPSIVEADARKEVCEEMLKRAEDKLGDIKISQMLNVPGKLVLAQTLKDRGLPSSREPKVTSNCAVITDIENYEEQWIIHYDYSKCQGSASNYINVELDNNFNVLNEKVDIDVSSEIIEIKVSSNIVIQGGRMITIYIASMYRGDLLLEKILLKYNDLHFTETQLDQLLDGAGMYTIRYNLPPDFNKIDVDKRIRGEVHYRSEKTGKKGVYRFYNQKVSLE